MYIYLHKIEGSVYLQDYARRFIFADMQIEDVRNLILSYPYVVERHLKGKGYTYVFQGIPFATIHTQSDDIYISFILKESTFFSDSIAYAPIKRTSQRRRHNTYIALNGCDVTLLRELTTEAFHQASSRVPRIHHPAYAATIGFFDGVHKGHQFLLEELKQIAKERGLRTMVITFDPSPFSILHPERCHQTLTSTIEKERLIYDLGIDEVYILRLDKERLGMNAFDFMRNILKRQLNIKALLLGHDHTFGSDRPTSRQVFNAYGKQLKMEIFHCSPYLEDDIRISSSCIKQCVREGKIAEACKMMGHPHHLTGVVTTGQQIGRKLGFPTANLTIASQKLLPPNGVYAVRVGHQDKQYKGILNIGIRPTIGTAQARTIEVHLLDFKGNLYDHQVRIDFVERLRDEQQFKSLRALQQQIQADKIKALEVLS